MNFWQDSLEQIATNININMPSHPEAVSSQSKGTQIYLGLISG